MCLSSGASARSGASIAHNAQRRRKAGGDAPLGENLGSGGAHGAIAAGGGASGGAQQGSTNVPFYIANQPRPNGWYDGGSPGGGGHIRRDDD